MVLISIRCNLKIEDQVITSIKLLKNASCYWILINRYNLKIGDHDLCYIPFSSYDKIATPFWVWLKIPSPWCTIYEGKGPSSVIVGLTERSMNYDSVVHWIKAHFFSYFPWHPSSTMEEKNQSKYLFSVKLSAAGFNKIRSMFCFTTQGPLFW